MTNEFGEQSKVEDNFEQKFFQYVEVEFQRRKILSTKTNKAKHEPHR
jgi:hypothetical protein